MGVKKALEVLKYSEFRYTQKRELILRILAARDTENLSARDILLFMQKKYSSLTISVIEKNLEIFKELNLVEEIDDTKSLYYRFILETKSEIELSL
ncbi:MAG TPA: transcriptional repressor [Bacillota bacterium]|nr:transcriptional repressor [Bacillota bacterium]